MPQGRVEGARRHGGAERLEFSSLNEADSTDGFFDDFAGQRRIAVRALTHPKGIVHTLLVQLQSSGRKTPA